MRLLVLVALALTFSACGSCGGRPPVKSLLPEGEPCAADGDCESGLCFALKGEGNKCGRKCATGCDPATQICTQLGFQKYGCVPKVPGLCRGCETNTDCPYAADSCLNVGGSLVCGQDCSFDSNCPEGFRCGPARDYVGNEVGSQCTPKSLTCDCTPDSVGMRIPCDKSNDAGVCLGVRICDGTSYSGCSAATPLAETCNGLDDDCDMQVDEDLGSTSCGTGECRRTYATCVNGRTQMCTPGVGGTEVCNERDDDCDGTDDNGFDKTTVQFCGSCTNACAVMNGTAACVDGGTCAVASCNMPWGDCSAGYVDGCETNLSNTVTHCGQCGRACTAANATSACTNGSCTFTCLPGFMDVIRDAGDDGCETGCDFVNPDVPDLSFSDSNCDGIDGDPLRAIFVDGVTGNDANPGTRMQPKRTVAGGIAAGNGAIPKKAVYVSMGTYSEAVSLVSGVSLYGGYNAAMGWARSNANLTTLASTTTTGLAATALTQPTEVQLFTITSQSATTRTGTGDGLSSYGVSVRNVTAQLTLRGLTVNAGNGFSGANGPDGVTGPLGTAGGNASGQSRGGQGASQCGAPGGFGGSGINDDVSGNPGSAGTQASGGGVAAPGSSGGSRGACGTFSSNNGGAAPAVFQNGGPGGPGVPGSPGANLGSFSNGLYTPASGGDGSSAFPGGGGGGGGSGGGTAHGHNLICGDCASHWGGGGGGGGGGGCGGLGGGGGRGGGGSFGVFVSGSPNVVIDQVRVTTGNGGNGGTGGAGGLGGLGGAPGVGAAGQCHNDCSTRCGGRGADGSRGGAGGQGGGGSGGTGGPTLCVTYQGTLPTSTGLTCNLGLVGQGGIGGQGGNGRAPDGADGLTGVQVMAN